MKKQNFTCQRKEPPCIPNPSGKIRPAKKVKALNYLEEARNRWSQ